jgi:branched-chain amino acid transport system substrate-binding protein
MKVNIFLLAVALLAPAQGDPEVIKIVSSLPRTGSARGQTDTIVNGIRMALDEVDHKIGPFAIRPVDLAAAPAAAVLWPAVRVAANADQAIKDPDVMVYIGTYNSGAAKVSMPKLNRATLLMISPANTATGLTKPGMGDPGEPETYRPSGKINYTRVVPADDIQGSVSAEWAKSLGLLKVYVLDDREVYGKGIADLFQARAEEIGLKILGREGIDGQAQEFKPLMTKVKAVGPDLIYFGGTTQTKAGQLVKDMVAVGLKARFMCPDGCFEQAFIEYGGADHLNDRALITFGGLPAERLSGKGKVFVENYLKKFGKMPEAYAAYGYECAKVALEAIRRAGKKDRDAIRAAGVSLRNFDGVLGKWSFDKNGDTTIRTMSGNTVKNGKFAFLTVLGEE